MMAVIQLPEQKTGFEGVGTNIVNAYLGAKQATTQRMGAETQRMGLEEQKRSNIATEGRLGEEIDIRRERLSEEIRAKGVEEGRANRVEAQNKLELEKTELQNTFTELDKLIQKSSSKDKIPLQRLRHATYVKWLKANGVPLPKDHGLNLVPFSDDKTTALDAYRKSVDAGDFKAPYKEKLLVDLGLYEDGEIDWEVIRRPTDDDYAGAKGLALEKSRADIGLTKEKIKTERTTQLWNTERAGYQNALANDPTLGRAVAGAAALIKDSIEYKKAFVRAKSAFTGGFGMVANKPFDFNVPGNAMAYLTASGLDIDDPDVHDLLEEFLLTRKHPGTFSRLGAKRAYATETKGIKRILERGDETPKKLTDAEKSRAKDYNINLTLEE